MKTWHGELHCGLCGDKAIPTYPVVRGLSLGVICGRCDYRMLPSLEQWERQNNGISKAIVKLAEQLAAEG